MNDLTASLPPRLVVDISKHPERMRDAQVALNHYAAYAADMNRWPEHDAAVREKLRQQKEFCIWWGENVSPRESPGRQGTKSSADHGTISMREAEKLTGIKSL
jgi:hypothetical protein